MANSSLQGPYREEAEMDDGLDERLHEKALCIKRLAKMKKDLRNSCGSHWDLSGIYVNHRELEDSKDLSCVIEACYKEWYVDRVKEWNKTAKAAVKHDLLEPSQVGECPHIEITQDDMTKVPLWAEYYDTICENGLTFQIDFRNKLTIEDGSHRAIVREPDDIRCLFSALALAKKHYEDLKIKDIADVRKKAIEIGMLPVPRKRGLAKKGKDNLAKVKLLPFPRILFFGILGSAFIWFTIFYLILEMFK